MAFEEELRQKICETATVITKEINYRGAGTVEFILDTDGKFYFLEMNTRLQVEHPITELVTGADLVFHQINVAQGGKIELTQKEIFQRGHAIEVRIYAEDPANNFFPTTGEVIYVGKGRRPGVRLDTGIKNGDVVGVSFDPMVAKLIAYAPNRAQCIEKLKNAIVDYPFLGLKTNREYLINVLSHEEFHLGNTFTSFVDEHDQLQESQVSDEENAMIALAHLFSGKNTSASVTEKGVSLNYTEDFSGFRNQNL